MKQSFSVLAAGLVAAVSAQGNGPLPACGNTCLNNMLDIARTSFGCSDSSDLNQCACCHIDFGYGIRDCSRQNCGSSSNADDVISYASRFCASAVTACPSGTPANNAYGGAVATASGSMSSSMSGSMSGSSMPMMTSSSSSGAVVGGSTSSSMNGSMSMSASASMAGGAFAAAESRISLAPGRSNVYILGSGKTVTAGKAAYENSGTTWSALPGTDGILIAANGASTTYVPTNVYGTAGKGATVISNVSYLNGAPVSTLTSGDVGYATTVANTDTVTPAVTTSTNTVVTSSGFAAMRTAAPAMVGAAAMAVLAL